jgi:hypothetical protein
VLQKISSVSLVRPIPVAPQSKGCLHGLTLAGVAGSSRNGGMDICLFLVKCVVRKRSLRRIDSSYRGILQTVVFLSLVRRYNNLQRLQ